MPTTLTVTENPPEVLPGEPHEPHWVSRAAFPIITLALFATEALLWLALRGNLLWLAVPLVLVASHLMHGQLIGFHEASHGMLRKNRRLNEFDGVLIGAFSFTSFSLYRAAHQTHHVHLSTARDEEFWPFVQPGTPRWWRVLAAVLELTLGAFFTPLIFLRTFLRPGSPIRSRKVRRRVWAELALMVALWGGVVAAVAWFGVWREFLWMVVAPAVLAGNLQSWRKYIEHVGLTGATPNGSTRSVVPRGPLGRLVAFTLLHEPYHGVHHQHAGVPHAEMPRFADSLQPKLPGERPPFPSYRAALWDLLRNLPDPRVGAQWNSAVSAGNDAVGGTTSVSSAG